MLETVLYIGMIAILLPASVSFVLQLEQQRGVADARTRMEQTAGLVFAQLTTDFAAADGVRVSTSTLGVNPSTFRFTDAGGTAVVIDAPTVSVAFPGGTQDVRRLRMQVGAASPVYLTDGDIDVTQWQVVALRDSANVLTGVRVSLDMAMIAATTDAYRKATFTGDTTIALSPHTIEQ